jgi:hypothetical protein
MRSASRNRSFFGIVGTFFMVFGLKSLPLGESGRKFGSILDHFCGSDHFRAELV